MSERQATDRDVWRELVAASKKSKGSLYTRYVNRNAAIPLTYTFVQLGVHPNVVSLVSTVLTHAALVMLLLLETTYPVVATAYVILVLGYMLDSCDGQLARVTGKTSKFGEWLDHTLDMVKLLNFNMVLSYLLLLQAIDGDLPWAVVLTASVLNLMIQPAHFFAITLKILVFGKEPEPTTAASASIGRRAGGIMRLLRNGADYGLFMMLLFLLPTIEVFLYVYLAYGVFYLMLFVSHLTRTFLAASRPRS